VDGRHPPSFRVCLRRLAGISLPSFTLPDGVQGGIDNPDDVALRLGECLVASTDTTELFWISWWRRLFEVNHGLSCQR
jgi:hypothetical protein